jgi:hypothetical protein
MSVLGRKRTHERETNVDFISVTEAGSMSRTTNLMKVDSWGTGIANSYPALVWIYVRVCRYVLRPLDGFRSERDGAT